MTTGRGRLLVAVLTAAVLLAVVGSVTWVRRDRPVDDATIRAACRAVVAYREASDARGYLATRKHLAGALTALAAADRPPGEDVRAYARALLGAPADGSGHLLLAAAQSCRQAGAPALLRELAPLLQ